jgi:2-oxoacid:acceptor oxidoreductase delta subunit (pyruvate/2-ketoisovalerate family)
VQPELDSWQELPVAGVVPPRIDLRPRTGSYRTGVRPEADLSKCVNCLLCWVYCPDSAIQLDGTEFVGIDLDFCKGCEICAEVCPTAAIEMVAE